MTPQPQLTATSGRSLPAQPTSEVCLMPARGAAVSLRAPLTAVRRQHLHTAAAPETASPPPITRRPEPTATSSPVRTTQPALSRG